MPSCHPNPPLPPQTNTATGTAQHYRACWLGVEGGGGGLLDRGVGGEMGDGWGGGGFVGQGGGVCVTHLHCVNVS